ncbi:DUF2809 domain-containing protein ['Paenibacillus yunnanensis' Narsing Rao et al. 2020]|uniref:ribosomal maturation YjgA family protein n=1 Tax=Paenibacillus tengchongensis TaxID=2608684 RepID=UPI00124BE09E|nr:DUF2809 domain-containing protein [Paenibacillus tengchongensis]
MAAKLAYSCAVLLVMVSGLGVRAFGSHLPPFVTSHFGDALWAAMIYFAFRVLLTRQPIWVALVLGAGFSYLIEFSQLVQADWVNEWRSTRLGGLILGRGFLWIDLLRYTLGLLLAGALDFAACRLRKRRPQR